MKKTLLLIVVLLILLCAFSISASAEEYTDSLTITDTEAEFFELTDEEKSKFNLKRPEGFKVYSSGNMVELVSKGGSIDEIMNRLFDEQDYIKDVSVVIKNDNNNGCYRKYLLDDRIYTYTNASLWWQLKNYFWDTDKISQLEGLNISEIYCILSEHPLGTVEFIFYYVTNKGDYVILLGSASYVYFMPASALIDCAKKHVEDSNKYGVSNKNMVFSEGIGSGVIREYLINPKTPDVTPTPTPTPEVMPTPTPTPTPMPTPIPEVTPTPTPTPSVTVTPSSNPTDKTTPIPTPTILPSETTAPSTETAPAVTPAPTLVEEPKSPFLWISLGGAAVILLAAVGVLVIRRKK